MSQAVAAATPPVWNEPGPTEMVSVSGFWDGNAYVVWETASETGTAGYRVSRVDSKTGAARRLPDGEVAANLARPAGGAYRVQDPAARANARATYRLEELRLDGEIRILGDYPVTFRRAAAEEAAVAAPAGAAAAGATTADAATVRVTTNGLHAVRFDDLAACLGRTPAEVETLAAGAGLAVRNQNQDVAYLVDAPGQRLVFYGGPATNRYTRTNLYWIEQRPGPSMARIAPGETAPAGQTFLSVRHVERDRYPLVTWSYLPDDLFYWDYVFISTSSTASSRRNFPVPLDGYAGGDAQLAVHLVGWSDESARDPDHLAEIYCNDVFLGEMAFDGAEAATGTFTAAAGTLLSGSNTLTVVGVLQSGQASNSFVVDGFDVTYTRNYAPAPDTLIATAGGHTALSAGLFTDPVALDITVPSAPKWIADESGNFSSKAWAASPTATYALMERSAIPVLSPTPAALQTWMTAATNAVDYLVIAPRALAAGAARLADYRAAQGLRTRVAEYEAICDLFAGGLNTPEAIRDLLLYARAHWTQAPWMVVLVGHGHYDYLGALTAEPNHLPPLLAATTLNGLKAADGLFADLAGGDEVPDVAVGRLPAQTEADLTALLDKIVAYELAGPRAAHGSLTFVADGADDAGDFTATNEGFAAEAAAGYAANAVSLDSVPVATARAQTLAAFTNGVGLVHYTGHGTSKQFAGVGELLLQNGDVPSLTSPPVPAFLALTCLLGQFETPGAPCLGEQLVLRAGGGALAVYAPAGLSWNDPAGEFGKAFYRAHVQQRQSVLGLALLRARQSMGVLSGIDAESLRTYNLLGDPALKLRGGIRGGAAAADNFAQWRWDHFSVAELSAPAISAAAAVPAGSPFSNFTLYALGLSPGDAAPHPPGAWTQHPDGSWVFEWRRRGARQDVRYDLWVSEDLQTWEKNPEDLQTLTATLDPDGVMETVRTLINRPLARRLFMRQSFQAITGE